MSEKKAPPPSPDEIPQPVSRRLRQPAMTPAVPDAAVPLADNPAARLQGYFEFVWRERMRDLPFVNPALSVSATGFRQVSGDWVGAVVTPWFLSVFLLPGGGKLWEDTPTGERRVVWLPVGTMEFIAENCGADGASFGLGAYQYCPLMTSVTHLPDMVTAMEIARDALVTVLQPVAAVPGPSAESAPVMPAESETPAPSRRAFFRRIVGKKT
jgi:[NiFe] hydrogenase assembly HybE family chaperone